jgi:molybdopterin/thiamine biosynthesis adenylyltransferase
MALTDTQIERYSRQIILPEIGGRGQEKLLGSTLTLVGVGPLAHAVVPYLAGAGIGAIVLRPVEGDDVSVASQLAARAAEINPDVHAVAGAPIVTVRVDDATGCDVICETSGRAEIALAVTRAAQAARTPIVAAGVAVTRGWISTMRTLSPDAGCVFCGWLDASEGATGRDAGPLTPTVVGAVAALVASSVIDGQLGFERARHARWLRYDAETTTLEERAIAPREDCPLCAGAWKNACHPTLAS